MKQSNNSDYFWPSYADLMTSLFFIMLVLYILTVVILKSKEEKFKIKAEQYDKIQEIEQALIELDPRYFEYDDASKRYRLKIDVQFKANSENIFDLDESARGGLRRAGHSLYELLRRVTAENPNVNYLLIVEGNTQRVRLNKGWNYELNPDGGYRLSYGRALSLFNYWKSAARIDFNEIPNCEIMLVGSGYFGKSRDAYTEKNNRRFSIQITAKVGDLANQN